MRLALVLVLDLVVLGVPVVLLVFAAFVVVVFSAAAAAAAAAVVVVAAAAFVSNSHTNIETTSTMRNTKHEIISQGSFPRPRFGLQSYGS